MLALLLLTLTFKPVDQIVPPPHGVKVANERVVLMTDAGNIVIALYPEIAPKNVKQIMNLVQAGVYNGTCFPRIEKNFVMQLSAAESDRIPPLPGNLMSLIRPLPAEHSQLKHVRGVISMAREDKDINSAKTSFSILLGSAPHLDGNYTIVGHVEYGMDVVEELIKAPLIQNRPRIRLKVHEARLVTADQLAKFPPLPAKPIVFPEIETPQPSTENDPLAQKLAFEKSAFSLKVLTAVGISLMIACCLVNVYLPNLSLKQMRTINLVAVLIGAFVVVALLQPLSLVLFQTDDMVTGGQVIAIIIFFGLLGVFRLMSSFESAA